MKSANVKLQLSLALLILLCLAAGCAKDEVITIHVPDFQLMETRKYKPINLKRPVMGNDPEIVALETVSGFYCISQEDASLLFSKLQSKTGVRIQTPSRLNSSSLAIH